MKMLKKWKAAAVAGVTALVAAPMAFASTGGGLGAQMLAKLAGVEADVQSVLVVLVGVIALFILYSLIKRARA
nr:hypothetical protein [Pseudoxanthomonas sp.]